MNIYTKLQSTEYIDKLNLNKFEEVYFKIGTKENLTKYLDNHKAKYYVIRDKINLNSNKHKFKATREDILKDCVGMEFFSLNISSFNYREDKLLIGDIMIKSNDEIYLCVSNNRDFSVRDARNFPDYNLNSFLDDRKLKYIKGLDLIIDYIMIHKLRDVIIEFAVFNIKLGIKNENVIIYELRTHY